MDVRRFYDDVSAQQAYLCKQILEGSLPGHENAICLVPNPVSGEMQRQASHVWLCSLFHPEKLTTPGRTMAAVPRLAAHAILSKTHRVATPDEIAEFNKAGQSQRIENEIADRRLNRQRGAEIRLPEPKEA